jgi:hypothetical protein
VNPAICGRTSRGFTLGNRGSSRFVCSPLSRKTDGRVRQSSGYLRMLGETVEV